MEQFNKIKTELSEQAMQQLKNVLLTDTRIAWMKDTVKNFNTLYMLNDWSGWCDGDPEYPIFRPAYDGNDQVCATSEYSDYDWGEKPSEDEIDEIYMLDQLDRDKFIECYYSICYELKDVVCMIYGVGETIAIQIDEFEDKDITIKEFGTILKHLKIESEMKMKETISVLIQSLGEIKQMKKLVPSFDELIIGHGWSGFNDGDEEYSIIRCAFDYDYGCVDFLDSEYYEKLSVDERINMLYEEDLCCVNTDYLYWDNDQPKNEMLCEMVLLDANDLNEFIQLYNVVSNLFVDFVKSTTVSGQIVKIDV